MSGLRSLLQDNPSLLAIRVPRPETVALPRAIRAIKPNGEGAVSQEPIEDVQARLAAAARAGDLGSVARRDLRRIPQALFAAPNALVKDDEVLGAALAEVDRRGQRSAIADLVRQYVEHFDGGDAGLRTLAAWLRERVDRFDWPWRERSQRLRFFEPAFAPQNLAALTLRATEPPRRVLASEGLDALSLTGGLGARAFSLACAYVEGLSGAASIEPQARLLDWARGERPYEMAKQWPEFVCAMLLPWRTADPPEEHRRKISDALVAYAGDPRSRGRASWSLVEDDVQAIFRSWLARATVLQFLDVVGEVARDDQWRYRRAFWTSYLHDRLIEDAWVAFGSRATPYARRMQDRLGERGRLYGSVEPGTGRSPDQSALLVRIGDLLIVDWSHNGRYNVWRPGQGGRPRLYEDRYNASDLDAAPLRESHTGSPGYHWQQRLAEIIRRDTKATVDWRRWRPER